MSANRDAFERWLTAVLDVGRAACEAVVEPAVRGRAFGRFEKTPAYAAAFERALEAYRSMDCRDQRMAEHMAAGLFALVTEGQDLTTMSMAADLSDAAGGL